MIGSSKQIMIARKAALLVNEGETILIDKAFLALQALQTPGTD
jgi:DeoR/GlpR family transcriptional regulator of sugar metabolism